MIWTAASMTEARWMAMGVLSTNSKILPSKFHISVTLPSF